MTRRTPLLYFCIFLLLAAQQGAFMHAVWHAHEGLRLHSSVGDESYDSEDAHQGENKSRSNQASLCVFDIAFGQVLGGAHGVCAPLALVPTVDESIDDVTVPRPHAEALSPKSRGPPVLL